MRKEVAKRSMYKLPQLYDLAFSFRNFDAEVTQALDWYREFTSRELPHRAIEFASGPARHAMGLARNGILVDAVDSSREMCRYARQLAEAQCIAVNVMRDDIVSYCAPYKYDLALIVIDSIAHLHTEEELITHFDTAADLLTNDGIYIIETSAYHRKFGGVANWTISDEHQSVQVEWRSDASGQGESKKINDCTIRFRWTTKEGTRDFEDRLVKRKWYPGELVNCAIETGRFRVAGRFGEFGTQISPDSSSAFQHLLVLQRT